jgi:hypothetical protein
VATEPEPDRHGAEAAVTEKLEVLAGPAAPSALGMSWGRFVRHYGEMVVAMVVGMLVLGPLAALLFGALGLAGVVEHPVVAALVMATTMTIGMSAWMAFRRHPRGGIVEMAAAMYVSFVGFFVPFWAGWISGGTVLVAGHVVMLVAMLLVMLRRREEYGAAA